MTTPNFYRYSIPRAIAASLLFVSILSLLNSCQTYRDTTTYFNVYYDAKRHLDIYEEKMAEPPPPQNGAIATITTHRWLDEEYESRRYALIRTGIIPQIKTSLKANSELTQRSGDLKHLDSVVILGSKILADKHPSAYVEDALYIVGKALYYKSDFSGAKRKFNELFYKYPNTNYAPEVGRFLTRALLQTRQLDSASKSIALSVSRAEASGSKEDKAEAHKLYSEFLLSKNPESLTPAAEELGEAEKYVDDEEGSRLAFERGGLYYLDGNWSKAEAAFAVSIAKSSNGDDQGEAKVAHALALRRMQKYSEAKTELQEVLSKSRYTLSHPPALFEYTYTVDQEARSIVNDRLQETRYRVKYYPDVRNAYMVLDTTYRTTSQAIMVRSRFRQVELFRSMIEFDSAARLANAIIGTKDFSTQEINDYVNERMRALIRYAEMRNVIYRTGKLERLIERSRENGQNILATLQREIRTEAERQVLPDWSPDGRVKPTPEQEQLIKEAENRIKHDREAAGSPVMALRITDTVRYMDSLRFVIAKAHFELGRSLETFTEQLSAVDEYRQAFDIKYVASDTSKNVFKARTLFTWIELDHQLKNFTERDSLITILQQNFGETVFAAQAGRLYSGNGSKESSGERAYSDGYVVLKKQGLEGIQPLRQVSITYNHEDVAPRALYAIGLVFEEKGKIDSAVYYYRRVINEFPFSKYADEIRPRLPLAQSVQSTSRPVPNVNVAPVQSVGSFPRQPGVPPPQNEQVPNPPKKQEESEEHDPK